jgi:tetratricopeptide (TPR) repeat protein
MRKFPVLLLLLVTLVLTGRVQAANLDDAHRAFAEGRYHDSTLAYQAIIAEKGYSAPVLFDLGNSYYRERNVAQAILAYKRAQWLAPGDPEIATNLQRAETQAGVTASAPSRPERLANALNATTWAWIGCGAWTLFCLSILARVFQPERQTLFTFCGSIGAILLAIAIAAVVLSSGALGEAVVTDRNAAVLISPFPNAQKVFAPSPGETVKVEKAYEDFLLVTDSGGHSGWISRTQVTPVIPSA